MTILRWLASTPFAMLATFGIFLVMAGLIKPPISQYADPEPSPEFNFIEKPPPETTLITEGSRKPLPDPPPPIKTNPPSQDKAPDSIPNSSPEQSEYTFENRGTNGPFPTPVIRTAPIYPESCRSRNAAGKVVVRFDVTPEGSTTNIQVIQSPDRCFVRTVRNTVAKWKYPPTVRNGRAVTTVGLTETFNFELVD